MTFKRIKPDFRYLRITEEIWNYVYERDGAICQLTGAQGTEVHHVVYKSHGGGNAPNNLVLLSKKGHDLQHASEGLTVSALKQKIKSNEEIFRRRLV